MDFIQMLRNILDWSINGRATMINHACIVLKEENDLRELPRSPKTLTININSTSNVTKENNDQTKTKKLCNCKNCREVLDSFSECVVCLEPLQCAAISSCIFCGNYTCWTCSEKVNRCPFCRANFWQKQNRIRNFAIERILVKLDLPCRYARWGCPVHLKYKDRIPHEKKCQFVPKKCPFKVCHWQGTSSNVNRHLKDVHDISVITSNATIIEIPNFHNKLLNALTIPYIFAIKFKCFGNIFTCKLKMLNQRLKFIFYQLFDDDMDKNERFNVSLKIYSPARCLRGFIENISMLSNSKTCKGFDIPGESLIPSSYKNGSDVVKICIDIKPVN